MKGYYVSVAFRNDSGMNYAHANAFDSFYIEAVSESDARDTAIRRTYDKWAPNCSHVIITKCELDGGAQ